MLLLVVLDDVVVNLLVVDELAAAIAILDYSVVVSWLCN
jgi:hypothetical protein